MIVTITIITATVITYIITTAIVATIIKCMCMGCAQAWSYASMHPEMIRKRSARIHVCVRTNYKHICVYE